MHLLHLLLDSLFSREPCDANREIRRMDANTKTCSLLVAHEDTAFENPIQNQPTSNQRPRQLFSFHKSQTKNNRLETYQALISTMTSSISEDWERHVGLCKEGGQAPVTDSEMLRKIINVKLAAQGFDVQGDEFTQTIASDLFRVYREQSRQLESHLCPMDTRIQEFLNDALKSTGEEVHLPSSTLCVDRYGLARELSFPDKANEFHNSELSSYRLSKGGVLHNPINDKRTTKGVFHVADYGLPVPADKIAVPLVTYARLLKAAFRPPEDLNTIPYTSNWKYPAQSMVSLQLRPLACPAIPGRMPEKRLEVRFFVPGSCVANLDFVESIFGNAGDPELPENDAGLDVDHWTGTTGCVVLAPHLRNCIKKDLGLPHVSEATEYQKSKGLCWTKEDEPYNGGKPFKITLRDERGIMVTILADNYFGKCKKLNDDCMLLIIASN